MKNFYYVMTFNLTNSRVKHMLERLGVFVMTDTMIDFKTRSKLFLSFSEATSHAHEDFEKKLKSLYTDDKKHNIRHISVLNPSFALPGSDFMAALAERFGGQSLSNWDDNCCSVLFFADLPEGDEGDEHAIDPNSWMVKYEVLFAEDAIELSGNGDFVFSPMQVASNNFTSTYH